MYEDCLEKGNSCSYETYRKAVKSKNISFAKLGEEECEICLLQDQHRKNEHVGEAVAPEDCIEYKECNINKEEAVTSRFHYRLDAEQAWPEKTSVRSVDLQKVIMLPCMPGIKTAIFTRRIVAYHETFASVGKRSNKKKTISVVWHEGTVGRSASEVTSAYATALEKERDTEHIVYWVDNCSAQNKNWCLLSSLVCLVNSNTISTEDITLKYFEPVEVVELKNDNVKDWKDGCSAAKVKKVPKLAEIKVIQLRRGSRKIFVKLSHEEEDFTELDFLQNKFELKVPTTLRPQDKGVQEAKKIDILQKLCPFMPPTRRLFWSYLPVWHVDEE
ncbi:hypothetical protein SKAU_G00093910 [Synaphobranchus kaupii]|uniref:Uncharacterized protein n=1 Tax=Synaphobranchus kaupii TaxID=118154 RepID=A0A9Q1J6S2_SYNKA|nr:hypothetical protein SKAU_G00093910 [Synaphobranchus kaupii]